MSEILMVSYTLTKGNFMCCMSIKYGDGLFNRKFFSPKNFLENINSLIANYNNKKCNIINLVIL